MQSNKQLDGFVVDVETDDLYLQSKFLWTVWLKDVNDKEKKLKLNPFKDPLASTKLREWVATYNNPIIAAHYGLGFDLFILMKFLGLEFSVEREDKSDSFCGMPCRFIDTLYLSMYLEPDMQGHGLADWGDRLGLEKIDFFEESIKQGYLPKDAKKGDEFKQHTPLMDTYCERDVDVNILTLKSLWKKAKSIYTFEDSLPNHYRTGQKAFFLMSCQEFTGWKFDMKFAEELSEKIQNMMAEIEQNVLPQLPPRKLKKGEQKEYKMPANPFKKDGSLSAHMLNFIQKHKGELVQSADGKLGCILYGKQYNISGGVELDIEVPMEIKDGDDLKEWFIQQGWKPTLWNFKKGSDGKPIRDNKGNLTKTSPKIQEAGKICPNLEELDGELPKQIVKFLSLRNRLAVLTGWMSNWRLSLDGRIGASRTGITPTQRQKHSVIVNCPKASDKVLLGKEFRSLWICGEGFSIAAGDAAALEGRVMGHYTHKYDNGETAEELLNGDPHSKNAFAFYEDDLEKLGFSKNSFDKDNPKFKPFRDRSKNGFYALTK